MRGFTVRNKLNMDKKISLRLDAAIANRLERCAYKERVPVSYILRHLVLRYLSAGNKADLQGSALGTGSVSQGRFPLETAGARRSVLDATADLQQEKFRAEVFALFDGFRSKGHDAKESARLSNFALKGKSHPWATYEVIADILRKSGRFRRKKGIKP